MWKLIRLFSLAALLLFLVSADIKREFDVSVEIIGKTVEEKPKMIPPERLQELTEKPKDLSYMLLEPPEHLEFEEVKPLKRESGISCGEPKDFTSYMLGVDYYLKGDYASAERELKKVIAMPSPFKPMAEYVLGTMYLKRDKKEEALELFRSSCGFSHMYQKASCELYYALNFKLYGGVPQNTDPLWGSVFSILSGKDSKPSCNLAVFKDYCGYVLDFYEGKEQQDYRDSLRMRRAVLLFKKGDTKPAESIFRDYSKPLKPYRDVALYYLGIIQMKKGAEKEALANASILETINPSLSKSLYAIISSKDILLSKLTYSITEDKRFLDRAGILAYNSGDYSLSFYYFSMSGNVKHAVYSAVKLGDYAKAYNILKDVERKDKEEYAWLLESAYWSGKTLGPILEEIRGRYPDLYREYTGWYFFRNGDWEKAAMYLEEPYYKALAYFNMKNYHGVIEVLREKDSQRDRILKAKAALFLGKPNISRSFLTERSDDERYLIGLSYFLENDYQEAFKYFDSVSFTSPIKPKAILKAGDALYNAGNTEEAKKYYYELLQKYPNSEYAKYATLSLIGMGGREVSEKDTEKLIENYLSEYPQSSMADELKYQLAQIYIKDGKESKAREILTELISTPLKYKAILKLAELENSTDKRMILLYKVYREGNEEERKQARNELIKIYSQVGDRKSIADILAEGSSADKVKAIGMYLSMGDDENAKKLAKELIQGGYRDSEFESYLLELYKLSGDEDYLKYLKNSKDNNIRSQAIYFSGMNELKKGNAKKALEDFVDISINYKGSSVYNQAIIEGAKVLIDMNAKHDASCFLNKADKDTVTREELDMINSLKGKLPKCEVR